MGKITTYNKDGMLFESQMGEHRLLVEGPESWGGNNTAPTPPQLFMASIGSCVGVLVRHFCDTHHLDASGMSVDVTYDSAEHPTRFTNIVVTIHLPNALCDDQCTHNAIRQVAEHCPVHETITLLEEIQFEIKTK